MLSDLVKRLTLDKTLGVSGATSAVWFELTRILDANDFEAEQSGCVVVGVDLDVHYTFVPSAI